MEKKEQAPREQNVLEPRTNIAHNGVSYIVIQQNTRANLLLMSLQSSLQALAKLEPFLLLGKSARGSAAAKLIVEATAAPGCYVFAELLDLEGIQQVRLNSEDIS